VVKRGQLGCGFCRSLGHGGQGPVLRVSEMTVRLIEEKLRFLGPSARKQDATVLNERRERSAFAKTE
jgi:hypothetical protein